MDTSAISTVRENKPSGPPATTMPDTISVRKSTPGSTILTYGRVGIDRCRAVITHDGYGATLRIQLNYHALNCEQIEAVETAIADITRAMLSQAATLRAAHRPLFDIAALAGVQSRRQ